MKYTFSAEADMKNLVNEVLVNRFKPGDVVKGVVVGKTKKHILVDLNDQTITGVITGKEMNDPLGTVKTLELGQEVLAIVTKEENDDGVLLLSLRKAGQIRAWDRFQEAYLNQEVLDVVPSSANKGGLLVETAGIKAFIPVSQLSPENYPRVDDSNTSKILEKLQNLLGKKFQVRVIGIDREAGKLIFSEREAFAAKRKDALKNLKVGDIKKGKVSGIVKFGLFVTFDELEGLVHISEIAWGHVKNPAEYARVGDDVDVKVIGVEGEKISLSMKQLKEDPWVEATKKYEVGKIVKGTVNKISEFGAFVTLDKDVNGLIHLSEIDNDKVDDPNNYFKEGEEVEAKVIEIDTKEHRIALSLKALKKESNSSETEEKKDEETQEFEEKTT
jgi:small subunit ribosomal protein S1